MRFNEERAQSFAEYVLPVLMQRLKKSKRGFLSFKRSELAAILTTKKLHDHHIDLVRESAADEGIAMAEFKGLFLFFNGEDATEASHASLIADAVALTDEFEPLYGSSAADKKLEELT